MKKMINSIERYKKYRDLTNFYHTFLSYKPFTEQAIETNMYKEEYIKKLLKDGLLYKFVCFDENVDLCEAKINSLIENKLWASYYKYLEDQSELELPIDYDIIRHRLKLNIDIVRDFILYYREVYDICCFSYEMKEYMWVNYANNHNGFCLCFDIIDYDKLFPVRYINKKFFKKDMTYKFIKSFDNNRILFSQASQGLSILPLITKDLKYIYESEIRFFEDSFKSYSDFSNGILYPGVKDDHEYKGRYWNCDYIGLRLRKIIIGNRCNNHYKRIIEDYSKEKGIEVYHEPKPGE